MNVKVVQYGKHKKIKVSSRIYEVTDGVYYIIIEFNERVSIDGYGDNSIVFYIPSNSAGADFEGIEVILPFEPGGILFGEVIKKTYFGTYYYKNRYNKIVTEENLFLTEL